MTHQLPLRPFDQILQKTASNVDKSYSIQKSTYKGFIAFFKQFSSLEKDHSQKLSKLSKDAGNYIGLKLPLNQCLAKENQVIKTIISELLYAVTGQSQMHYNFSERLSEIAQTFNGFYETIKATKDQAMVLLTQAYPNLVSKAGQFREGQQKKAMKGIYDILDKLHQNQLQRVQKIRENIIIAFTLHKKICEKQQEMLSTNNQRISSIQTSKVAQDISGLLIEATNLYNAYPGDKIQPKVVERVVQPLKDSLRQSVILRKQQVSLQRIQISKNTLRQVELQAQDQFSRLMIPLDEKYKNKRGLFTKDMKGYLQYSQKIQSVTLGRLAYALIEGFYFNKMHDNIIKGALTCIRIRLKAQAKATTLSQTLNTYIQNQYNRRSEETKSLFHSLIQLSRFYSGKIDQITLKAQLQQLKRPALLGINQPLHIWVSSVIINILLDSLVVIKDGESFLIANSTEIFNVISQFAKSYFDIQPQLSLFMFLQKVLKIQQFREQRQITPVLQQMQSLLSLEDCKDGQMSDYTMFLYNKLKNDLTLNLTNLYNVEANNSLAVQCLCWLQIYVKTNSWALEHIYQSVRAAGYKWLLEQDQNKALLGNAWESNQKLKLLTEALNQNQFQEIQLKVLRVIADKLVVQLNLQYQAVLKKIRQKFFSFIIQIVLLNLDTIPIKQLVDKEGYCLRLGIELCKIDILCNYSIKIYDNFFNMLLVSLNSMESQYKQLLLQTKKTELWIVQDNMFATQNCYDFCTLLAKPIQYMSGVIKELGQQGYSSLKTKFITIVKLKLQEIIRVELVNYMAFMSHSVRKLEKPQPKVLVDPPKLQKLPIQTADSLKQDYFHFKQSCKRLSNIIFIKQNSNQIVKDMLSSDTFNRLQDIFDPTALQKEIDSGKPEEKQLLQRIQQIVKQMNRYEDRSIFSIATGAVLTSLRQLLDRLYWRQPKQTNAFEDFFSGGNKTQLRFSEHTLMSNKQTLQDYVMLIKRNVPIEHYARFSQLFFSMFALAVKCEILNPNKFRVPIEVNSICQYLNVDIANITNFMKKQLNDDQVVVKCFYEPLMKVLRELREQGNKLVERYQKGMISKNQTQIDQTLAILYIRGAADKKLKQFAKRVRTSMK